MRIISGIRKGKKIVAPADLPVRPTTDYAKESLFNVLNNFFYFDGIEVLDLFAGTGNISYEFAAREAISVLAVDSSQECINFIAKTAESLSFDQIKTVRADVWKFLQTHSGKYNVIFADPPFDQDFDFLPDLIFEKDLLHPDGFFVMEHGPRKDFSKHPNFYQMRNYGKVHFSFFIGVNEESDQVTE
ncbi:MAG: RsmD family RNA methyltransferase [Bacteroidales bacterium]|nr:RsmD family RNA methyltransferase [Bacteroidales bacterium]